MSVSSPPRPSSDASSQDSDGEPFLSPRAQIRALLAANDSDNEENTTKKTTEDRSKQAVSVRNDDDESEEEEEDVVRPRGRFASRMQADDGSAEPGKRNGASLSKMNDEEDDDEDEDDVVTVARSRGRAKSARDTTLEQEQEQEQQELETATTRAESPASPGLFVTPNVSPSKATARHDTANSPNSSEDELPDASKLSRSARFTALVARKREEKAALEAAAERERKERLSRAVELGDVNEDSDSVSDITDDEGGRTLTQKQRPAKRQSSKKAQEEMARETQRMSRNMQLAHEAKTKKKISKAALFERFNFKPRGGMVGKSEQVVAKDSSHEESQTTTTTSTTAAAHDMEMTVAVERDTPATTPPSLPIDSVVPVTMETATAGDAQGPEQPDEEMEMPDLAQILEKGKGKAIADTNLSDPVDLSTQEKASESTVPPTANTKDTNPKKSTKRRVHVKLPAAPTKTAQPDSSDSELEITNISTKPSKHHVNPKIDAIFQRVPVQANQESKAMFTLRQLAHAGSSPTQPKAQASSRPSMTAAQLGLRLRQQWNAQAQEAQQQRLEEMRARGVHVPTREEREMEHNQVEELVAVERRKIEAFMEMERREGKKERAEGGGDGLDDSDDGSYSEGEGDDEGGDGEGDGEDGDEVSNLSGSEDEEDEENEEEGDEEAEEAANPLINMDAEEGQSEDEQPAPAQDPPDGDDNDDDDDDDEEDDLPITKKPSTRRQQKIKTAILSDDEEDDDGNNISVQETPRPKHHQALLSPSLPQPKSSPLVPTSVLRSATKTFIPGIPVTVAAPAGLGLTQMFNGTMDDSQSQPPATTGTAGSPMEFMPSLDQFPDSQFSATADQELRDKDALVFDSQHQKDESQNESQSQLQLVSQNQTQIDSTQPDLTQDGGFAAYSPLKQRFIDDSHSQGTVNTVVLADKHPQDDDKVPESPLETKKTGGRLRRRADMKTSVSSVQIPSSPLVQNMVAPVSPAKSTVTTNSPKEVSAFTILSKAARRAKKQKLKARFNAQTSKARDMVDAQAEESEDEYAGLGGADIDESSDEEERAELREAIIDDSSSKMAEAEERALAGFHADREREAEKREVDKLFHDITTGVLRKRRRGGGEGGNGLDLSDDDDGGEAKRRMKRRQFAKMQKALLQDERVGKMAENPRSKAFLKSMEDRGSDSEGEGWFVGPPEEGGKKKDSQEDEDQDQEQGGEQQEDESIPDSQPGAPVLPSLPTAENKGRRRTRNGAASRNSAITKKPSTLADVRRELSSLLDVDDGSSIIPATDPLSDGDVEDEDQDDQEDIVPESSFVTTHDNKANRHPSTSSKQDIVDRAGMSRSNSSTSSTSRLAFANPASTGSYRVPNLLRRATTNSLVSGSSSHPTANNANAGLRTDAAAAARGVTHEGFQTTAAASVEAGGSKLKRIAGKRSGVNGFARENERREKAREKERKREERRLERGVKGRGEKVGGLFAGGSFE